MLYLRNYDKPGFIGALGSMMGELGVNIATFHLGRKEAGGEAVALIEIDGSVTHDTLQSIRLCLRLCVQIICSFQPDRLAHLRQTR